MLIIVIAVVVILFIGFLMLPLFFNTQDEEDAFFREMYSEQEIHEMNAMNAAVKDLNHPIWEGIPLHERDTARNLMNDGIKEDIANRRSEWRKSKFNKSTINL